VDSRHESLLAGLTTKKSRTTLKLPKHQENVPPTKDITLFDGYLQENIFTWRPWTVKKSYLPGAEIIISLSANHQENTYHQQKKL